MSLHPRGIYKTWRLGTRFSAGFGRLTAGLEDLKGLLQPKRCPNTPAPAPASRRPHLSVLASPQSPAAGAARPLLLPWSPDTALRGAGRHWDGTSPPTTKRVERATSGRQRCSLRPYRGEQPWRHRLRTNFAPAGGRRLPNRTFTSQLRAAATGSEVSADHPVTCCGA